MEYHIINLVVPMYERAAIPRLTLLLREERYHIFEMWYLADRLFRVNVTRARLSRCEASKEGGLPAVKACGFPERAQRDGGGGDAMELCERADGIVPPRYGLSVDVE